MEEELSMSAEISAEEKGPHQILLVDDEKHIRIAVGADSGACWL